MTHVGEDKETLSWQPPPSSHHTLPRAPSVVSSPQQVSFVVLSGVHNLQHILQLQSPAWQDSGLVEVMARCPPVLQPSGTWLPGRAETALLLLEPVPGWALLLQPPCMLLGSSACFFCTKKDVSKKVNETTENQNTAQTATHQVHQMGGRKTPRLCREKKGKKRAHTPFSAICTSSCRLCNR